MHDVQLALSNLSTITLQHTVEHSNNNYPCWHAGYALGRTCWARGNKHVAIFSAFFCIAGYIDEGTLVLVCSLCQPGGMERFGTCGSQAWTTGFWVLLWSAALNTGLPILCLACICLLCTRLVVKA